MVIPSDNSSAASTASPAASANAIEDNIISSHLQPASVYEEWVARLYQTPFFHPINNGLKNIQRLHSLLGNPMDDPDIAVIHIAGTNGKGSVGLKLAKTFQALSGGYSYDNVCLYSSPHVSCFRERMQSNGQLISEELVAHYLSRIFALCQKHDIPATFFEITTSLAFLFFQHCHENQTPQHPQPSSTTLSASSSSSSTTRSKTKKKSIVILEAGLGGRLDATNVIQSPVLTIITSVGLDHTSILGHSIDEIALEKAGIMKANTPCLIGPQAPQMTLRHYAKEHYISDFYSLDEFRDLIPGNGENTDGCSDQSTIHDYDTVNTRIAMAAILLLQRSPLVSLPKDLPTTLLQEGTSVRPSCRFEVFPPEPLSSRPCVILDVAHNPAAMQSLVHKLSNHFQHSNNNTPTNFRFLLGLSKDKDWRGMFEQLSSLMSGHHTIKQEKKASPAISKIHLAQAAHPKALPLTQLVGNLHTSQLFPVVNNILEYDLEEPSVTHQLNIALYAAGARKGEVLVVCGSVFLMAEVRGSLGVKEPLDSKYLVDVATGRIPTSLGATYGNNEKVA